MNNLHDDVTALGRVPVIQDNMVGMTPNIIFTRREVLAPLNPRSIIVTHEVSSDLGRKVRVKPPTIQQDVFLDNEIGTTIRYIKDNFGSSLLLKAYNGALDSLKESEKRWKEYYEEEARAQSIFEAGED